MQIFDPRFGKRIAAFVTPSTAAPRANLAEILRLIDMPKATAYRAIQTLVHLDFIEQHPRTGLFHSVAKCLA